HRTVTVDDVGAGLTGLYLDRIDVRAEGAAEPLVATRRVQVSWNPWSLLGGTVEITEVRLVEPRIHVTRLPDGSLDVDDLTATASAGAPGEPPAAPAAPDGGGNGPPVDVVVRVFALQGGRLTFLDRSADPEREYVLGGIEARVTEITLDGPIPYELSADLPLSAAGRFSSSGTVNAATGNLDATLRVAEFELASLNPLLGGGTTIAGGVLGADLAVKLAGAADVSAGGTVEVAGLTLAAGEARGATTDLSLHLQAGADLSTQVAQVKELSLVAAGQTLTATLDARNWGTRPHLTFLLQSEELRVEPLLAVLPQADAAGPAAAGAAPTGEPAPKPSAEPADVPLEAVGDVKIARLHHGEIQVENLAVHVVLKENKLRVDPATASLYGGTVVATAGADLSSEGPVFDAAAKVESLQLGKLLGAASPKLRGALTGTAALDLTAAGQGGNLEALVSRTQLTVKDGKLVSHPLVQQFTELFQMKEYQTLNFYDLLADVGTEAGLATVDSLIFRGPNLQATGKGTVTLVDPTMNLHLAVALPREVAAKVVGSKEILATLTDKEGWTRLPLRLEGTPAAPRYGVDSHALEKVAAKALEKKAQRVLEEKVLKDVPLDENTRGVLDKGMKSLFGR
ncbi:MAG TPA: AsmA-like C-terminal region-containing protein, partial [Deferrisomatales bacterium]|nr:AsmA-like C-terminal region-containing protein [Deferrisomatales bacterium]